jgi:hypothetical protein
LAQNHGFWWKVGHALGIVQTPEEQHKEAEFYRHIIPGTKDMSDKDILHAVHTVMAMSMPGEGIEGEAGEAGEAGAEAVSKHGELRMAQREVSAADLASMRTGTKMIQADGATAFVKGLGQGKYDVLIEGEKGVVTVMKGLSGQEVRE